jgi:hypothetical protein
MRTGALSTAGFRMTANQMGAKIAELLSDPNMSRYSATTILAGLNDAIAEWCIRTRGIFDEIDIQFVAAQREYNVKTAIDAGGNRELGVIERIGLYSGHDDDWPQEFLKGKSLMELDMIGMSHYGDGPAEGWYNDICDFHKIEIIPVPDTAYDAGPPKNHGAFVVYSAIPSLMTYAVPNFGNLDTLLPTLAQLPICYGAAAMILEDGQGEELILAQERMEVFEAGIEEAKRGNALALTDYGDCVPM